MEKQEKGKLLPFPMNVFDNIFHVIQTTTIVIMKIELCSASEFMWK